MNFSHYIVVFMPSFLAWECGLRLGIMGYDNLAQRKTNQTELMAQSQICPCVFLHTIHLGKSSSLMVPFVVSGYFIYVCMCIKIHKFDVTQFS